MRPAFQPFIAFCVIKALSGVGVSSPFTQAMILRILSAILSLTAIVVFINVFKDNFKDTGTKKWFIRYMFLLWFIVYLNVRFSAENWAASLFFLGIALLFKNHGKNFLYTFLTGLILGFSFLSKYQAGLMIFGLIVWLVIFKWKKINYTLLTILGIITAVFLGILIDKWFYGELTFTSWNYININLFENKVSAFGIQPWWYYFSEIFNKAVPPFSLVILLSYIYFIIKFPKNVFTFVTIPFLLVHILIGHKELRFLFPLEFIIPYILMMMVQDLKNKTNKYKVLLNEKFWLWFNKIFWILNIILLIIISFKPADENISLYKFVYKNYAEETHMFYMNQNPFNRVSLDVNFYKRKNLNISHISSFKEMQDLKNKTHEKNILFVCRNDMTKELKDNGINFKIVYKSLPDWLKQFNFFDWYNRAHINRVYQIY